MSIVLQENLFFYGGKGINVSTILNTLGLETTALGFVAGFTGKAIEDGLAAQGIHTDFIHLQRASRINVKVNMAMRQRLTDRDQ
mgnify:CR=1 FL=1